MMKKALVFRPERCLMCLSCVLACQLKALGIEDPRDQPLRTGPKPPRRLSMVLAAGTPWPERCRHCTQAPCAEACISGSIVLDDASGAVRHRPETCVGCGTCRLVCPFNGIAPDDSGDCMTKCSLCPEDAVPRCVEACGTGALTLSDGDRHAQEKRRTYAREMIGDRRDG
ncbi:MAG: 4Fe-4S dicluster domain-containing protein [Thermodesulfobacteriota bacterium]